VTGCGDGDLHGAPRVGFVTPSALARRGQLFKAALLGVRQRASPSRYVDRRCDGASLERLSPHRGVPMWGGVPAVGDADGRRAGLATRGGRMSQVDAVCLIRRGRLPFESYNGVAQRRNRALSDAPLFAITLVYRAVGFATLQNHPHTRHTGEPL